MRWFAGVILLGVASGVAFGRDIRLVRDGIPEYVIVLEQPGAAERRGAQELGGFIRQMSGADIDIVDGALSRSGKAIVIRTDPSGLSGPESFRIKSDGNRLVITGGGPRGTMYGCTALLEKLGVRFFTPKVTRVPRTPTIVLPDLDETQSPAFEYRETNFAEALDKNWAAHLRFNGHFHQLDDSVGGKIAYHHYVHSFDDLVPRELFASHPEYFPLIGGQRKNGYVQRCLSNPEVLKIAIAQVNAWIREQPAARIYSVSQNDTGNWCQCDACTAIANKFGGNQSGLYIWFVNQVAEAIEKDHPDKLIDTLAYQFTEAPPTGIAPRANVRVRLCPIDCCESHPYESCDTPASRKFIANLAGWAKLTDTLYIWHYNTNFAGYLQPFPDFDEFTDSARLYKRSGVKGIFFEGDYATGGGGADAELKSYVIARLLWDPGVDANALVDEWITGVYGAAAKPMREWFDLLHAKVRDPNVHMHIYDPPNAKYLGDDVIAAGERLFDEAEKLAARPATTAAATTASTTADAATTGASTSGASTTADATSAAVAAEYIAKSRLGLRYVKLMRQPQAGPVLDDFLAAVRRFGITQLREGQPLEKWERNYRALTSKK